MCQADTPQQAPPVAFVRAANRLVRPLVTSRLHRILSRFLMLLTYTGRKSGRRITIPAGYFDWEPGTVLAREAPGSPTCAPAPPSTCASAGGITRRCPP